MIKLLLATGVAMSAMLLLAGDEVPGASVPVQMVVTVEARHGKDAPALNREDFMVYQGHDRLRVMDSLPLRGDHAGLELFLMLDESSAGLGSYLGDLRQFINSQPAPVAVAIGYMANGTFIEVQGFVTDHAKAGQALRLPFGTAGSIASPYLSLTDLIKRWPPNPTRRVVLMVTDGIDRFGGTGPSNPYVDAAIAKAQRAGIVVYNIYTPGIGHYGHSSWRMHWGQNYLAKVAEETGGEAYFLGYGAPVSFTPYLKDLAERLTHQYLITVQAKPGKKAGFQPVRLTTEVPNAEVVGASRIYVPASQ